MYRKFEKRGYNRKDVDKWLECDHEFNLKAYVLSVDTSIPLEIEANIESEPRKPITSFETVCRFCHVRESVWKEVFI